MIKLPFFQILLLLVSFLAPGGLRKQITLSEITEQKKANAISCTPDRASLARLLDEQEITLLPGSGTYVWPIKTGSDSAQLYFNQGINTYYGFHIIEAIASFKKAAKFDPDNPMVWWGQALAYGPNINDVGYSASPDALIAVSKAMALMDKATPSEQALIRAMQVRYNEDSTILREKLNQEYSDAMKAAYEAYPESADIAALYADAMMLQHPWDLWNVDGTPKAWTPLIRDVLEKALLKGSRHPGLHHYYIHVIEPSPEPAKAKKSADILGTLTPGLAHLVHMPSHIYLRTGEYNRGIAVNKEAVAQYRKYNELFSPVAAGSFIYYLHNQHMLVNCAMHAGQYNTSIAAAGELQGAIDSATLHTPAPIGSVIQYIYMSPVLINVRFAKWDSLLAMPHPAKELVYASLLHAFGQGMAYAATNKTTEARKLVDKIDELMKDSTLAIPMTPFSPAIEGAKTARELLVGMIHVNEKQYAKAINHLKLAAETEEKMVYNEPRDWFLNPHQYLGMAYLRAGNYLKAEEAFKKDLKMNAENIWSLKGLADVQEKQNKRKAGKVKS